MRSVLQQEEQSLSERSEERFGGCAGTGGRRANARSCVPLVRITLGTSDACCPATLLLLRPTDMTGVGRDGDVAGEALSASAEHDGRRNGGDHSQCEMGACGTGVRNGGVRASARAANDAFSLLSGTVPSGQHRRTSTHASVRLPTAPLQSQSTLRACSPSAQPAERSPAHANGLQAALSGPLCLASPDLLGACFVRPPYRPPTHPTACCGRSTQAIRPPSGMSKGTLRGVAHRRV